MPARVRSPRTTPRWWSTSPTPEAERRNRTLENDLHQGRSGRGHPFFEGGGEVLGALGPPSGHAHAAGQRDEIEVGIGEVEESPGPRATRIGADPVELEVQDGVA